MSRRRPHPAVSFALALVDLALICWFLVLASSCRACDITGVFNFCDDEGPHELIADAPIEWRHRAMDVQRALFVYTREHSPADTAHFVWRDSSAILFVRVLGAGIPGSCARTNGDSILIVAGNESDRGLMRHEFIHWTQPGNGWLQPHGDIHYRPIFVAVGAPLSCG